MNKPPQTLHESIAAYKAVHDSMKATAAEIARVADEQLEKARIERASSESIGAKT